jgi:excisionase family DNA binding protein
VDLKPNHMTAKETATLLGVSYQTVLRLARLNQLPHVRLTPKSIRFNREDVLKFVESKTVKPQPASV